MLKIHTFKASCSQTIINIVVKVVVRSFVSTSYVCNYLHGLSENNRKCCFPIVASYSPLFTRQWLSRRCSGYLHITDSLLL